MIEEVKSWGFVIQRYFLSICQYITFYIKRLGSLTTTSSSSTSGGVRRDSSSVPLNKHDTNSHHLNGNGIDRKQSLSSSQVKLKPSSEIPGPKCVPVFGTFFEFMKFGPKRVHELSVDRHAKYGDIFREKVFSKEMVYLANTDLLKQWMTQEGKYPVSLKQPPSLVFGELFPLKRGMFFRNGEDWYNFRKLGHHILIKNVSEIKSQGLFTACEDFFEGYMKDLADFAQKSEDGLVYDIEQRSYEIAVGALLTIVYGGDIDKIKRLTGTDYITISRNVRELNVYHQQLLEMPVRLAKWFGMKAWTEYYTKLNNNLTICLKYGRMLREEILKSPQEASAVSHGLLYKCTQMNAPVEDVDAMLTDFAVDTKDPFAATVMFVTAALGMHSDIQEKIYDEVCRVFPDNQPITHEKANQLEYTEAFFKEVLRLYPIAPFTVRVATEDVVIGEYLIKPGTMILYSSYVAQRDPRYFSDPEKLLPERWLNNEDGKVCDSSAFASFGLKGRICIGQHISLNIFSVYIAHLVRRFKMTTPEIGEIAMRTVMYPVSLKPMRFEIR